MSAPQVRTPAIAGPANAEESKPNAEIVRPDDAERKRYESLRALFALAGHEMLRCDDGSLFACRWGHARRLRDLDDAEEFLARIGGGAS